MKEILPSQPPPPKPRDLPRPDINPVPAGYRAAYRRARASLLKDIADGIMPPVPTPKQRNHVLWCARRNWSAVRDGDTTPSSVGFLAENCALLDIWDLTLATRGNPSAS